MSHNNTPVPGIREQKFNDYDGFVEKFKLAKTTDDCYTPPEIYEAVLDFARILPNFPPGAEIMRPFFPGGDYQSQDYTGNKAVVDNPPFSIVSKIVDWYLERDIPFLLFAPALTLFCIVKDKPKCTALITGVSIVYENGAHVPTAFVTNMDDPEIAFRLTPRLGQKIGSISERLRKAKSKKIVKKVYPDNIISSSLLGKIVSRGIEFAVKKAECRFIRKMEQQESSVIYGGGYILSDHAAAERAAAERIELSDNELGLIAELNKARD